MSTTLSTIRLCMENRMIAAAGTGVSTYARALHAAHRAISPDALLLSGGSSSAPGSPNPLWGRVSRQFRALSARGVRARAMSDGLLYADVFRTALAYYALHRQPMPVRVPGPPGIMHWSYPIPLRLVGWRNIYTVHDVIPLTHPQLSPIDASRHRRLLMHLFVHADKIATVSQSAADAIVAELNVPPGRIVNCAQPVEVDSGSADGSALPAGLERGRYLLICGTVEPRKNIRRILDAYQESMSDLPLVIAGPDGAGAEEFAAALQQVRGVRRLPYQSRSAMMALIAHARALLMPSLAEGFGLPVAEAMAFGTPVITSNVGALAETAGDGALLVDPLDVRSITEAIVAVDRDEALCRALSTAGRRRAQAFRPEVFAQRLEALYTNVLASS